MTTGYEAQNEAETEICRQTETGTRTEAETFRQTETGTEKDHLLQMKSQMKDSRGHADYRMPSAINLKNMDALTNRNIFISIADVIKIDSFYRLSDNIPICQGIQIF